ncbi:MAG: GPR endopeptidase [Clostridia bacterium]|nr:GPR endopeptidase [Clostridia bacterium]
MNKCYLNFRTDMADERVDTYKRVNNLSDIDGIKVTTESGSSFTTTVVEVLNKNGSNAVKKEIGKYITMELYEVEYLEEKDKQNIISDLANQIKDLVGEKVNSVMVVGIGNSKVTPDALGPKVVSFVNVTRHLLRYAKDLVTEPVNEISAISPGVMGTTGIETEEIIEAIVERVKPDVVIAIDSLASMSVSRVGKTIQLSNTGITPGQGVGNSRRGINKNTLKVPVIAIRRTDSSRYGNNYK